MSPTFAARARFEHKSYWRQGVNEVAGHFREIQLQSLSGDLMTRAGRFSGMGKSDEATLCERMAELAASLNHAASVSGLPVRFYRNDTPYADAVQDPRDRIPSYAVRVGDRFATVVHPWGAPTHHPLVVHTDYFYAGSHHVPSLHPMHAQALTGGHFKLMIDRFSNLCGSIVIPPFTVNQQFVSVKLQTIKDHLHTCLTSGNYTPEGMVALRELGDIINALADRQPGAIAFLRSETDLCHDHFMLNPFVIAYVEGDHIRNSVTVFPTKDHPAVVITAPRMLEHGNIPVVLTYERERFLQLVDEAFPQRAAAKTSDDFDGGPLSERPAPTLKAEFETALQAWTANQQHPNYLTFLDEDTAQRLGRAVAALSHFTPSGLVPSLEVVSEQSPFEANVTFAPGNPALRDAAQASPPGAPAISLHLAPRYADRARVDGGGDMTATFTLTADGNTQTYALQGASFLAEAERLIRDCQGHWLKAFGPQLPAAEIAEKFVDAAFWAQGSATPRAAYGAFPGREGEGPYLAFDFRGEQGRAELAVLKGEDGSLSAAIIDETGAVKHLNADKLEEEFGAYLAAARSSPLPPGEADAFAEHDAGG